MSQLSALSRGYLLSGCVSAECYSFKEIIFQQTLRLFSSFLESENFYRYVQYVFVVGLDLRLGGCTIAYFLHCLVDRDRQELMSSLRPQHRIYMKNHLEQIAFGGLAYDKSLTLP